MVGIVGEAQALLDGFLWRTFLVCAGSPIQKVMRVRRATLNSTVPAGWLKSGGAGPPLGCGLPTRT